MANVNTGRRSLPYLSIALVLVVFASLPVWGTTYLLIIIFLWSLYLTWAGIWNLLAGYSGLISLGQQIFIGLGGYMLTIGSQLFGLDVWLSVFIGAAVSVLFAFAISLPTFRMKGVYFAIGTWVAAEAVRVWFSNWVLTDNQGKSVPLGMGVFIKPAYELTTVELYYAALILGFATIFASYAILRSKLGLGLMAIRDNELAAASSGVNIFQTKLVVFLFGAFMTGLAGGVYYLYQNFIQPTSAFSIAWTVIITSAAILGGIGTIEGPLVGAAIAVLLQQYLAEYIGISLIIQGAIIIAIMIIAPQGIVGTLHKVRWYQAVGRIASVQSQKSITQPRPSAERPA